MTYPKFTIMLLSGRCAGILVLRWYFSLTSQAVVVYLPNEYTRFTMKMQMEERGVWLSALAPNKRELCILNMAEREGNKQTPANSDICVRRAVSSTVMWLCLCAFASLFLSLSFASIYRFPLHSLILHHLFFTSFNPNHCKMLTLYPSQLS